MATEYKDHFSGHARAYATHRPKSPEGLFPYLASLVPARNTAWDVGTGNGQAAISLAPHFDSIIATDASADQIREATPHPKVKYAVARAESSGLLDASIDLVAAAQAVHWFDFDKFYGEVRRVAKPHAAIAVWTYGLASVNPDVDRLTRHYYDVEIARYWPPERKLVDEGYASLPFPFREIQAPKLEMREERDLAEWVGYISTWSATQRAIKAQESQIFETFVAQLERAWGDPTVRMPIIWPLYIRAGYVS